MFALEGYSDPLAVSHALRDIGAVGAVLVVVIIFAVLALLFWRGSEKLGIIGAGTELQLTRKALERSSHEQSKLRADFRVVVAWIARREGSEPPLAPLSKQSEEPGASSEPEPLPPPPAVALPAQRLAPRASRPVQPRHQ